MACQNFTWDLTDNVRRRIASLTQKPSKKRKSDRLRLLERHKFASCMLSRVSHARPLPDRVLIMHRCLPWVKICRPQRAHDNTFATNVLKHVKLVQLIFFARLMEEWSAAPSSRARPSTAINNRRRRSTCPVWRSRGVACADRHPSMTHDHICSAGRKCRLRTPGKDYREALPGFGFRPEPSGLQNPHPLSPKRSVCDVPGSSAIAYRFFNSFLAHSTPPEMMAGSTWSRAQLCGCVGSGNQFGEGGVERERKEEKRQTHTHTHNTPK